MMARKYSDRYNVPVILVAGNHEYYGSSIPKVNDAMRRELKGSQVHFLDDASVILDGVVFLGATLWTDYNLNGQYTDADAMTNASYRMNDHRLIEDFIPVHALNAHFKSLKFLRASLRSSSKLKAIIITHHAPSSRSINPKYADDHLMNACFASNLESLIETSNATLWVHGHVHTSFDYRIGDTRVVCNPRGYYPRDLNPDFDPNLLIEV
jgi:Icc-related predicted phosphoesterase